MIYKLLKDKLVYLDWTIWSRKQRGGKHIPNMGLSMWIRPENGILMVGSRMPSIWVSSLWKRTTGFEQGKVDCG